MQRINAFGERRHNLIGFQAARNAGYERRLSQLFDLCFKVSPRTAVALERGLQVRSWVYTLVASKWGRRHDSACPKE